MIMLSKHECQEAHKKKTRARKKQDRKITLAFYLDP
jgi:hypothetical protein